jgi:hypothetical protein
VSLDQANPGFAFLPDRQQSWMRVHPGFGPAIRNMLWFGGDEKAMKPAVLNRKTA